MNRDAEIMAEFVRLETEGNRTKWGAEYSDIARQVAAKFSVRVDDVARIVKARTFMEPN